ncbi:MAG TPA: tetratricopeptide repeat protein [Candidatus Binataceae bacterium]|nr:tetratricopeptide repeat protein [Candidatus Binataceae bacterium]
MSMISKVKLSAAAVAILIAGALPGTSRAQLGPGRNEATRQCIRDYTVHKCVEATRSCKEAAEGGSVDAELTLGHIYYNGRFGVPRDYAKALYWYRKAGMHGNEVAQTRAGIMFRDGMGVPRDGSEAKKWLLMAGNQGYAPAQFMLGSMYYYGQGVAPNRTEALKWFRKSAAGGNAPAQDMVNKMTKAGDR